jgi:aminodeoxyfutalosine deaminase
VALIAASGAAVVLCPRSNARLGVGHAPAGLYHRAGVPLALGTDSLASNDSLSLWDELGAAARAYAGQLSPAELLAIATLGGARALGLQGEMGALTPGWGCHFQVVEGRGAPPDITQLAEYLCREGHRAALRSLVLSGSEALPNA